MSATPEHAISNRRELANAIRALSMDAVQKAKNGHPGMPMGMADLAQVLWSDYLRHNPGNPQWFNRDRFIISNGHGSMLLYSLLHLSGYDLSMDEIKNLRQLHSKTPGHPEYGITPGIETTTGPLGQGIANAVGMAIAERAMASRFNREGHEVIDHFTYVFAGDGCLMEGISHEACSLAGTLGLGKLIMFYDDNGISIDGKVEGWFTDDTPKRFEAYGWHVIANVDGHSADAVAKAIAEARSVHAKPSLICCKTVIGYGAPKLAGTHTAHGAALGEEEITAARDYLGWKHPPFVIPPEIYAGWDAKTKGAENEQQWNTKMAAYRQQYPDLAAELERRINGDLPADWDEKSQAFIRDVAAKGETMATRKASQAALNGYGPLLPELIGGSADLTGSNNTNWSDSQAISATEPDGNYIYFGVREFAMSAILNGLARHGGFIPYGGTFLVFSDYARSAVRMSALIPAHSIFVYTLACQPRDDKAISDIARGGYVLSESDGATPDAIIIATGSEVGVAMEAQKLLGDKGISARVVSMPCTQVFDSQSADYREAVLPSAVSKRVAVEAGVTDYWLKYVGLNGAVVGINRFGESAPGDTVMEHFGFTGANVAKTTTELVARGSKTI